MEKETIKECNERVNTSTELVYRFMQKEKRVKSEMVLTRFLNFLDENNYRIVKANYEFIK